jgi:hypothetical protein
MLYDVLTNISAVSHFICHFVGHVDGLEADQFIVKDKIIHAKYYRMDRELLETYQDGKVKLRINEQELKSKYEKDSPEYFSYGA